MRERTVMAERFISLLYPNEEAYAYHTDRNNLPDISESVCDELGLTEIFGLKSGSLTDFFTSDMEVISYRQGTLNDLMEIPELKETLAKIHPILDDMMELRRLNSEAQTPADAYLYGITEIELYVSCIRELEEGLSSVKGRIKSPAFLELCDFVSSITKSEYYSDLNKKLEALTSRVHEIKSITIGVNLDREFRPTSAGVISVNSEEFKSGKVLDKILRLSFKNDAFTCIANLSPFGRGQSENKQEALVGAFNTAIEDIFRGSVKGWRNIVGEYVIDNTDFLVRLRPEIKFISRAAELIGVSKDAISESVSRHRKSAERKGKKEFEKKMNFFH